MEKFTREQITKVINDCEKAAFDNSKNCFASAMDQALESIKTYFEPFNKKLKLGGPKCLASPCPCTAVKMNQCNDWCRFYPPTT